MLYRIKAPDRRAYDELRTAFKDKRIQIELPRHLTIAVEDLRATERQMVARAGGTFVEDYQDTTDQPTEKGADRSGCAGGKVDQGHTANGP